MKSREVTPGFMAVLQSGHARRKAGAVESADAFVSWFSRAVLSLQAATARAWPAHLAEKMNEISDQSESLERTDRTYLRRVARGERLPGLKKTYAIGEGLRVAGLSWCSGTLALLHHDAYRLDAYAVLDITSREAKFSKAVYEWLTDVTLLGCTGFPLPPGHRFTDDNGPRFVESMLREIVELNASLTSEFNAAWKTYQRNGIGKTRGALGAMYLVQTSPEFDYVSGMLTRLLQREIRETADSHRWIEENWPPGLWAYDEVDLEGNIP